MKTTYDILLNFKKIPYEFYEWKPNDGVEHIKTISVFKINSDDFLNIYDNIVKVDINFLNKIENKTEVFTNGLIKVIGYSCVLCNGESAVAVEFNQEGLTIGKSKLLLDEEDEIVMLSIQSNLEKINYKIISSMNNNSNYTRKEKKQIIILNKYLNMIKDDDEKIKYIYFECFDIEESNPIKALKIISTEINNTNLSVINKLYNLIKVLKK